MESGLSLVESNGVVSDVLAEIQPELYSSEERRSEEEFEELFGEGALARAPFNFPFFLHKLMIHIVVLVSGPLGVLLILAVCCENVTSMRYHRFIGCTFLPLLLSLLQPGCLMGLAWLCYKGFVLWLWPASFSIVAILNSLIVCIKYGSFTPELWNRIRDSNCDQMGTRIHALRSWAKITLPLMRVELRLASRMREQGNGDEHKINELPLRFIRVPPNLKEIFRDPAFKACSCQLKQDSADLVDEAVCKREQHSVVSSYSTSSLSLKSFPSSGGHVFTLPVARVAELLLLAANRPENHCSRTRCFQLIMAFGFALTPVLSTLYYWSRVHTAHGPQSVFDWLELLPIVFIAFLITFVGANVNYLIMEVSLIDMQRRFVAECSLLALMGRQVLADLPNDDSVVRQMRKSLFAGALLDLQDSTTVYGIQVLHKILQRFGCSWFQRCQIFLSVQLVVIILAGLAYLWFLYPRIHGQVLQVQFVALLMLVFFSLPMLSTLIQAIGLGYQLNLLGEEYWPLALHTARLNVWTSASLSSMAEEVTEAEAVQPESREAPLAELRATDEALDLMARHVVAAQVRHPVKILGLRASRNLIRGIRSAVLSLFLYFVKRCIDSILEKSRHPSSR